MEINNSIIKTIIFDLDGVIVTTDNYHFQAWKTIAQKLGTNLSFEDNKKLRGISRRESFEKILEIKKILNKFTESEINDWLELKNKIYLNLISNLTEKDIFPNVEKFLKLLEENKINRCIGSISKNANFILDKLKLSKYFNCSCPIDTNLVKENGSFYIKCAKRLNLETKSFAVIEDAQVGIDGAKAANMIAIGFALEKTNLKNYDIIIHDFNQLIKYI